VSEVIHEMSLEEFYMWAAYFKRQADIREEAVNESRK
jgi:hypothetical protein